MWWLLIVTWMFALSDPAALKKAKETWGDQAMIATVRDINQSNWTKQVGFKSKGCQREFTPVGIGFNTWDAAFADADMHPYPVAGPFAGTLKLQARAWDNVAISAVRFSVDSNPLQQVIPPEIKAEFFAEQNLDTTALPNGLHVVCAQTWDTSDNTGRSANAYLILVSQANGIANATFYVGKQ